MSSFVPNKKFKIAWADMEDSDDDTDNVDINTDTKDSIDTKDTIDTNEEKKINISYDPIKDLIHNINNINNINNSKDIGMYNYVTARIKNLSNTGLNKIEKNIENYNQIKIEFFYCRRQMKIHKMYKNVTEEQFIRFYNTSLLQFENDNNTDNLIKNLFQYCFFREKNLYIPFFYVDNKYFDTIKFFDANKKYKVVLYCIKYN